MALLVATTSAALQGYKLPNPTRPGLLQSADRRPDTASDTSTSLGQTSADHTSTHSSEQSTSVRPHSHVAAHTSSGSAVSGTDGFPVTGISSGSGSSLTSGGSLGSEVSTTIGLSGVQGNSEAPCKEGEVRHIDGSCIVPEITRKVFVVSVPRQTPQLSDSLPDIPPPRVDHNILFVRLPEGGVGPAPIVVPPPRQDNIVYVLSKKSQNGQRVIEVPAPPPSEPEIYFVNYDDGENPTLPGGVDLQSALASALEANGQVIAEGFEDGLAGHGGISGVVDIGNVEATFIGSNNGVATSGSTSQSSQTGGIITGNTYSTSSTISTSPVSGLIQSGGLSQGSQGGISQSISHGSTSAAGSFTTASNTGSFQPGGISTGSQLTVTTTGNANQPSDLYSTP